MELKLYKDRCCAGTACKNLERSTKERGPEMLPRRMRGKKYKTICSECEEHPRACNSDCLAIHMKNFHHHHTDECTGDASDATEVPPKRRRVNNVSCAARSRST